MTGDLRSIQKTKSLCGFPKREDKRRILKMCLKKMKCIQDSVLYKHVLIKNTLMEIQKNNKDIINISDTQDYSETKDDPRFSDIEELLQEIDLATENSHVGEAKDLNGTKSNTKSGNYQNNDIMEDFHANEAIGQTKIVLNEDFSNLFDLSI